MSISFRAVTLAAALVAGTAAFAAPASAQEVRTMAVSYKDLNLNTAEGQKMLARRIAVAANQVCAQSGQGLEIEMDVHSCKLAAKTRANAQLAQATAQGF